MTPFSAGEIELVRSSFAAATTRPDAMAAAFYQRLFDLDRSLRRLFHGDMRQLGRKFVHTLEILVNHLEQFEEFLPYVRELGARHAGYHVRDEYYAIVGVALIGTLSVELGDQFTPEVRSIWTRVYNTIADEMIAGGRAATETVASAPAAAHPPHAILPARPASSGG